MAIGRKIHSKPANMPTIPADSVFWLKKSGAYYIDGDGGFISIPMTDKYGNKGTVNIPIRKEKDV